jgi:type I restriction enzyme S subunit
MGNLESPYVTATRRTLTDAGLASCSAKLLPARSVILSSRAPIGYVVINEVPMATNQGCKGLIPGPKVLAEFLRYALLSSVEDLNALGTGATFKEVSGSKVKDFRIPLPPLEEQKRIVNKLDAASLKQQDLLRAIDRQSRNLSLLMPSLIEKLMGSMSGSSEDMSLGDLLTIEHGFAFKSEFFSESGQAEILTPGHFHESGGFRPRPGKQKYYTGEYPERFLLAAGTLLVAMTEQAPGLLGSPLLVPDDGCYLHNQRLGRVIPRRGLDPRFLYWVFNLPTVRQQLSDTCSGATVRHTSPGRIAAVRVTLPTDSRDQAVVAGRLDEFKRLVDTALELQARRRVAATDFGRALLAEALRLNS